MRQSIGPHHVALLCILADYIPRRSDGLHGLRLFSSLLKECCQLQLYVQRTRLIETVEKEMSECAATITSKKEYSVTSPPRSVFRQIILCDRSASGWMRF